MVTDQAQTQEQVHKHGQVPEHSPEWQYVLDQIRGAVERPPIGETPRSILQGVQVWVKMALGPVAPTPELAKSLETINRLGVLFSELIERLDGVEVLRDKQWYAAAYDGQRLVTTWRPEGRNAMDAHYHARALARQVETLADAYDWQLRGMQRRQR
ncbi:hypothetical protein ACWCPS_33240 [Streptomyces mauvecolor]